MTHKTFSQRDARKWGACLYVALCVAACGDGKDSTTPDETILPEYHGTYAVQGSQLIDLAKKRPFPDLAGEIHFIIYDKAVLLGAGGGRDLLHKADYGPNDEGLEVRRKSVDGKPEMLRVLPVTPLEPGLYVLKSPEGRVHFFVNRTEYAESLRNPAREHMRRKEWESAARLAKRALASLHDDAEMKTVLRDAKYEGAMSKCRAAMEGHQWEEATKAAEETLRIKPGDPEATAMPQRIRAARYAVALESAKKAVATADWASLARDVLALKSTVGVDETHRKRDLQSLARGAVEKGDSFGGAEDWEAARLAYEAASAIDRSIPELGKRLAEAKRESWFLQQLWASEDLHGDIGALIYLNEGVNLYAVGVSDTRVLDSATRKAVLAQRIGSPVVAALAPNERVLAVGYRHGEIGLFDATNLRPIRKLSRMELGAHVDALAFLGDGAHLASSSRNKIRIWEVETGRGLRTIDAGTNSVRLVAHPSGKALVSGGSDGKIVFWDVSTWKQTATLAGHQNGVTGLAFSSDSRLLASGGGDQTLRIWSAADKKLLRQCPGHPGNYMQIAFSPDGSVVAVGSGRELFVWDTSTGKRLRSIVANEVSTGAVAFRGDGRIIATGGSGGGYRIRFWGIDGSDLTGDLKWRPWPPEEDQVKKRPRRGVKADEKPEGPKAKAPESKPAKKSPAPRTPRPSPDRSGAIVPGGKYGVSHGSLVRDMTHPGLDIVAKAGTPVFAYDHGSVAAVLTGHAELGNAVLIRHARGYTSAYFHLRDAPFVKQGERVRRGDALGFVGKTGAAGDTPHLHLEFRRFNDWFFRGQGWQAGTPRFLGRGDLRFTRALHEAWEDPRVMLKGRRKANDQQRADALKREFDDTVRKANDIDNKLTREPSPARRRSLRIEAANLHWRALLLVREAELFQRRTRGLQGMAARKLFLKVNLAGYWSDRDNADETFRWLEPALRGGFGKHYPLKQLFADKAWDSVRQDQRFRALQRKYVR